MRTMPRRSLFPIALLAALTGCDLGPDYARPSLELPPAFRASRATAAADWPDETWWQGFGSPTLDALEVAAKAQNLDIAAAVARVRQADAQVRISGAALLPTVSATGQAEWQQSGISRRSGSGGFTTTTNTLGSSSGFSSVTPTTTVVGGGGRKSTITSHIYDASSSASYEVDFWGRNRAVADSAEASAVFSRFDQQVVALTVTTNVADTWFTALAYQDRLAVAEANLRDAEQTLRVIQARLQAGTASALDVAQEAALVAGVRATIPNLRSQMEQQIIGLGILTGRPPEAIDVPAGTLRTLSLPPVAPGLPSELLARRPDVAEAEANLVAANANIRSARAAFFPTIQLTGSAGFQSAALGTLFGPGTLLLSAAASLSQPIFDGGTLRGQLEQAKGRQDELVADYRKAVLQAFTDVETALTTWRYTTEQEALEQAAVSAAQQAADIARAQLAAGTVDITTVLNAQNTLYGDQDTLAQIRLARFQALLNLYKALGGGWTQPDGAIIDQFPGLSPGRLPGGIALPVGENVR
jgi:NodT family efflux transporter outer membrane factor (OMF) lipoprotein